RLLPLHPRATEALLHQDLARRLRDARPDRQVLLLPGCIVHPTLLVLVAEVTDRLLDVLMAVRPAVHRGELLHLLQDRSGGTRLMLQVVATVLQPLLFLGGPAREDYVRRIGQGLGGVVEVDDLGLGAW